MVLVDLGGKHSEVVVLAAGEPVFARTLSRGVAGLPASAPALASELRQTAAAFGAQGGEPLTQVFLLGGGAGAPGAEAYLSHELGMPVGPLPRLGRYHAAPETLAALAATGQIVFRYATSDGRITPDANPNGSLDSIAGICNEDRNVVGLMPHPERAAEAILGSEDGRLLFDSMRTTALAR